MGAGPRRVGRAPSPPCLAVHCAPAHQSAQAGTRPIHLAGQILSSHLNPPPTCAFPVFGFSLLLRTHQDSTGPNALFALFPSLYLALCAAFSSPALSLKVSFNTNQHNLFVLLSVVPVAFTAPLAACRSLVLGPRQSVHSPVLNSRARAPALESISLSGPRRPPRATATATATATSTTSLVRLAVSRQSLAALRTWSNRTAIALVARNSWNE